MTTGRLVVLPREATRKEEDVMGSVGGDGVLEPIAGSLLYFDVDISLLPVKK